MFIDAVLLPFAWFWGRTMILGCQRTPTLPGVGAGERFCGQGAHAEAFGRGIDSGGPGVSVRHRQMVFHSRKVSDNGDDTALPRVSVFRMRGTTRGRPFAWYRDY